ncbi:hypothetical protein ILYODFUR_033330 [Ilyodon furcidens]|uniref:Uncharacterized protein n=1 Tax=Ilyodon furcidens TaxID=33524 RepID=A0ABV0U451_9TELE
MSQTTLRWRKIGQTELWQEHAFKSLFLHNLHERVQYDVTMYCRTKTMSMQEIRKYAQMAWETRARPTKGSESEATVLQVQTERTSLALEGQDMPSAGTHVKNRFREQRRFGLQDRGVGNERQPKSGKPDNPRSSRRPDHQARPKCKTDGKGWNRHAEGILGKEMEMLYARW